MLLTLFRIFSYFPLPVLHGVGVVLGYLVYGLSPSYRQRMQQNMARAGVTHVRFAAIAEAGKSIAELPFIWCGNPQRVLASARIDNWQVVQSALDSQQGVILLTPHLGCFEIIAQAIAARTPLTALYRPPRKAALKPLIEGARARHNLNLAPANLSGVRSMLKTLKQGGAIGLLPDQVPQQGEGLWVDFFGAPAYTMTLPAKMQSMTDAPVIVCYARRLSWGRGYVVDFVPLTAAWPAEAAAQTRAINQAMEDLILRIPEQYFWSYHRYKVPAGVTPPDVEKKA